MSSTITCLATYLHLARAFWRINQLSDRDRLLVLSAVAAVELKQFPISNYCRLLILENNHGHMLRKWASVKIALEQPDFQHFVKQLKRRYPLEKAEQKLDQLGIDRANEQDTYYDDAEYAAAIMGVDPQWLIDEFGTIQ